MYVIIHSATRVVVGPAQTATDTVPTGYAVTEIAATSLFRPGNPVRRGFWKLDAQGGLLDATAADVQAADPGGYGATLKDELAANLRTKGIALKAANEAVVALNSPTVAQLTAAMKNQATALNGFLGALGKLMKREFGGEL